ncbi:hypothetical protein [Bacillus massiliigorillae]|uniref:hypothetical protein n=1 Tax=Bacillus massiliigorillae TaxID=1243664 RepID=UPI0003A8A587|nr:hypothetical protein [Bacillus massiliigorillae]
MLYIIIGGLIFFLMFIKLGFSAIKWFFYLLIVFILWKSGLLLLIIRLIASTLTWVVVRAIDYFDHFFGDNGVTSFIQIILGN